ncbi:hypothetical protein [Ekhidna sp.]
MGKYPVYAIMALVFIGIIKLIQVTAFDVEQYKKSKESSFANYGTEISEPEWKKKGTDLNEPSAEESKIDSNPSDSISTKESPSSIQDFEVAKEEESSSDESFQSPDPVEEKPTNQPVTYSGLDDLKNNYLAPIIASLPQGQLREDVVIRYYKHQKDGYKVYSLKALGYYIHEKQATETAGLGSNVLYYGDDVNNSDIQIVALTLLAEGLPIKSILPTQFSWKATSIEIGTDTLLINEEILSEADIKSFVKE